MNDEFKEKHKKEIEEINNQFEELMKYEGYKEMCKILNSCSIISCWLCNYLFMFYVPPLTILLTEIGIFIFINILLFIIWRVIY